MKALTLHEPYASLIAAGIKTIETRGWSTKYRGPLAIHAAARKFGFTSDYSEVLRSMPLVQYRRLGRHLRCARATAEEMAQWPDARVDPEMWENYPLGQVVAIADLIDVFEVDVTAMFQTPIMLNPTGTQGGTWVTVPVSQIPYGHFAAGRFAWVLANVRPLQPPEPAVGKQGIWEWES